MGINGRVLYLPLLKAKFQWAIPKYFERYHAKKLQEINKSRYSGKHEDNPPKNQG